MLLLFFTVVLPELDDVSVLGVLKVPEKAVPALVEVDAELSCPFAFVPPFVPTLDEVDDVLQWYCILEPYSSGISDLVDVHSTGCSIALGEQFLQRCMHLTCQQ